MRRRRPFFRRSCTFALFWLGLTLAAHAQMTVTSRQPARLAPAAPPNSAVVVGFSQAVSAGSVGGMRVHTTSVQGKRAGAITGGGTSTLTFTPALPFAPGEAVSVSLPASISNTAGGALTRQVYQFTAATGGSGRGFFLDTTIVGNTANRHQLLADVDRDGDLDLITTGALFGCRIFLNDGQGRYRFRTGLVTGQTTVGTAVADVDQDGDLDLLATDADNNTVTVCINDGTGNFLDAVTGAQNAPVGTRPVGVALGDVDGDGDLDFVTANSDGASSTLRLNNGSGLFTTTTTIGMGTGPTAVALGDIDNDGDLDLLTANAGTSSNPTGAVNVSRNSGTGSFGGYTSYSVGLQPTELVLADVDNDGDLDLLTANEGAASVSLRLNNGSGSFSNTITIALPTGSRPSGLRCGDVDADGDLDLVVAQGLGGRVYTFLNAGGTFTLQNRTLRLTRTPTPYDASIGVTLGDVDGDLDLDLITSDASGQVILSLNQAPPTPLPVPVTASLTPASGPVGATVVISGTNLTDVAEVRFNGTAAGGFLLRGAGTEIEVEVPAGATTGPVTVVTEEAGTATSPTPFTIVIPVPVLLTGISPTRFQPNAPVSATIAATFTVPITAATANNVRVFGNQRQGRRNGTLAGAGTTTLSFDPAQDFAPGEQISVVLPNSLQTFDGNRVTKQVVQFTAAAGGTGRHDFFLTNTFPLTRPGGFQLGDLDGDGDLDVAAAAGSAGIQLLLNNGAATFVAAPNLTTTSAADYLTVADFDADGDLDLVSSSSNGAAIFWRNDGRGAFTNAGTITIGANMRKLLAGDVDADGDLDLMAANGNLITALLNAGNGTFPVKRDMNFGTSFSIADFALGDVDRDGDLDLVTVGANSGTGQNTVVSLNDGTGLYSAGSALVTSTGVRVALGDVDADGDLDMVLLTGTSQYSTATLPNDGTGRFGTAVTISNINRFAFELADTDADGDLDIVNYDGVALNDGRGRFTQVVRTTSPGTTAALQVALGDVDADGDLDLLSDDQTGAVRVKLNRPGPPPALAGVMPGSGPVGSSVLLSGEYLRTATAVLFNGTAATAFTPLSGTQLVATVPAGATSGPITVVTPAGTAPVAFTVTSPLAVAAVLPARNTVNAPRTTAVSVTFAQPVPAATANELRVFSNRRGGRLTGTVTGAGTSTLTFTLGRPFEAGEALNVTIPDRLADASGLRATRQTAQFQAATTGTGTGLFLPSVGAGPYAGFASRYGLAAGDLDNDGDVDVVTSNGGIRFNNGQGVFADSVDYPLFISTNEPRNVALGDLDNDGNLDVISTNGQIAFNDGRWQTLQPTTTPGLGPDIRDLALGDVDSDGDLDFVAANYARDTVIVGFNDGAGGFLTRLKIGVGSRPSSVALGDVDGDGDLDLITANEGVSGSTISVARNNGIGWFGATVQTLSAGTGLAQAILGDIDGDHDLDLVTNNGRLLLNDGSGAFAGTQTLPSGSGVALADIDSDGDLDLVVSGAGGAQIRRNDGSGQFSGLDVAALGTGSQAHDPLLADLDGDGDLELLLPNTSGNKVHLLVNQRVAAPTLVAFSPVREAAGATILLTGTDFIGATSVTFNGTATTDFTVLTATQLSVRVPVGASTGVVQVINPAGTATSTSAFTVLQTVPVVSTNPARYSVVPRNRPVQVVFGQTLPTNSPATLAVFSQRNGGLLTGTRGGAGTSTFTFAPTRPYQSGELLSVSVPGYIDANQRRVDKQVFQFRAAVGGTGRGTLTGPNQLWYGSGRPPVLGDVDADGDLDIVNIQTTQLALMLNNGNGTFANPVSLVNTPRETLGTAVLGDIDGDGDLDLVVSDVKDFQHNSVVHVRFNNGRGVFSGTTQVPVDEGPQQAALVDVDADGDLDLVTGNGGRVASSTSVRFNDGRGNFDAGLDQRVITGSNQYCKLLQFGDVDADGDLDMLYTTGFNGMMRLNDGQGRFSRSAYPLPIYYDFTDMALHDVDNDGDLDIMLLRVNSGLSVRLNDGRGNFPTTIDSSGPSWIYGGFDTMTVGDLDADGDVDVAMLGFYNGRYMVMTNDGTGFFTDIQRQIFSVAMQPLWPVFGDLDGDGDLDMVSVRGNSGLDAWFNIPGVGTPTSEAATLGVKVYPNPAREQVEVEIPTELRPAAAKSVLSLYNSLGQLVLKQPVQPTASGKQTLRIAHLPAGVYSLRLPLGENVSVVKVIIY